MKILVACTTICFFAFLSSCQEKEKLSQSSTSAHSPASFEEVDQEAFEEILDSVDGLVILKVYSNSCHYCQEYVPLLERIANENPQVTFLKAEVPKNSSWAQTERKRGTPTLKFYRKGKVVNITIGKSTEEDIKKKIAKFE